MLGTWFMKFPRAYRCAWKLKITIKRSSKRDYRKFNKISSKNRSNPYWLTCKNISYIQTNLYINICLDPTLKYQGHKLQHRSLTYCPTYQLIVMLVIKTNHQSVSKHHNHIINISIRENHLNFKIKEFSLYLLLPLSL